jgi:hypothetical protein
MLLASAFRRARQGSNPFYDFQAPGAAYIDASAAARAFVGDNDRQPLQLHRCLTVLSCSFNPGLTILAYFTMIVPFIHGCGAHWKCITPF